MSAEQIRRQLDERTHGKAYAAILARERRLARRARRSQPEIQDLRSPEHRAHSP